MEWVGDLNDLIKFGSEPISEWCIKFNNTRIQLNKRQLYTTEGRAKQALQHHIYCNFCQGHYWHEKTNNTFNCEGGWMRNKGTKANLNNTDLIEKEFKKFSKDLTKNLLDKKIFTIEKI